MHDRLKKYLCFALLGAGLLFLVPVIGYLFLYVRAQTTVDLVTAREFVEKNHLFALSACSLFIGSWFIHDWTRKWRLLFCCSALACSILALAVWNDHVLFVFVSTIGILIALL